MLLLIPEDRKAVLIGRHGKIKKELQKQTNTKIRISDGVEVSGDAEGVIVAAEIVKAIGRGFSPRKAFFLLKENHTLHIISLGDETQKTIKRLFGRVIGKEGSARKNIEVISGAFLSVYGKTVSIIGTYDEVEKATRMVEELLKGRSHKTAYSRVMRKT